jgi:hypothetical protein
MPGMSQENRDQIKRQERFKEIFDSNPSDKELDNIVEYIFGFEKSKNEVIELLSHFKVDNCGADLYDLAQRVEDSIYRLTYGIFWKLFKRGKYLHGRHEWIVLLSKVKMRRP